MKNRRIAEVSIFSAIIILLQLISTYINFGSFPITLTLIPIIVGSFVYGEIVGAMLGVVFGVIVSIMAITGLDPSGALMVSSHPIITVLTCLIKGGLAGFLSGFVYKKLINLNDKARLIISSAICPIVNTLVFCLSLVLFYDNNIKILIAAFVSVNFVIELLINILLAPGLAGLINKGKSRYE